MSKEKVSKILQNIMKGKFILKFKWRHKRLFQSIGRERQTWTDKTQYQYLL